MNFKILLTSVAIFVSTNAIAAAPNLYTCVGKNLKVSYSTTSLVGTPQLSVVDGSGQQVVPSGARIQTEATQLGTLVIVEIHFVPDLGETSLTLVIPPINLTESAPQVDFSTVLVKSETRTSIGGPKLVNGALQTNQYAPLTCSARVAAF